MKISKLIMLGCMAILASSCSESKNEYHYFNVESPRNIIYADQTTDTLGIVSTDSWEASTEAEWITPKNYTHTVGPQTSTLQKRGMKITPNTSNQIESSYLTIKADGRNYRKSLIHTYWLNIKDPDPLFIDSEGKTITSLTGITEFKDLKVEFNIIKNGIDTGGEIKFNLYDRSATITSNDSWIKIEQEKVSRTNWSLNQEFTIKFVLGVNETGAERKGIITVKAADGAQTNINVIQKAK